MQRTKHQHLTLRILVALIAVLVLAGSCSIATGAMNQGTTRTPDSAACYWTGAYLLTAAAILTMLALIILILDQRRNITAGTDPDR